jgi:hypothetical protein
MLKDDREWFIARPGRRFRVRGLMMDEIPDGAIVNPTDRIVVRVICRDGANMARMRLPFVLQPGDDTTTDDGCMIIWRRAAAQFPDAKLDEGTLALFETNANQLRGKYAKVRP